jgi:hypothetical protein
MTSTLFSNICKITKDGKFESAEVRNNRIDSMLQMDKNYGYMKNTGIITYSVENSDQEISAKETEKAFFVASNEWAIDTPIQFMHIREYRKMLMKKGFVKIPDKPMIRISYHSESEDEILNSNTIAYMGYPTNGNTFYGMLVLNKRYHFTVHGNPISGKEMKEAGVRVQYNDDLPRYSTMDLDKIIRHELGHGVFGLPHSINRNTTMSSNEGKMSEYNSQEDITRAQAKAGKSSIPKKWKLLMKKYLHRWTDNY